MHHAANCRKWWVVGPERKLTNGGPPERWVCRMRSSVPCRATHLPQNHRLHTGAQPEVSRAVVSGLSCISVFPSFCSLVRTLTFDYTAEYSVPAGLSAVRSQTRLLGFCAVTGRGSGSVWTRRGGAEFPDGLAQDSLNTYLSTSVGASLAYIKERSGDSRYIRPYPCESTGSRPLSPRQTHESQISS